VSGGPSLSGKVALVTGASRGIGRAIALRLAAGGAQVMLTARDTALLAGAVAEIRQHGGRAEFCAHDLREAAAAGKLVDQTVEACGGIDIVVNNAGATKRGDFFRLTDDDWSDGYALKLFGAMRLTRAAWPHLQARRGSVVFVAGVGGRTPGAEFTIGGSVNAALLSLTKALADVGRRDGVQVNAVNPGLVRTDRLRLRLQQLAARESIDLAAAEKLIVEEAGITRIGTTDDIASLVAFVVGPTGRFLHGSLIDIDGGNTKTI